MQLLATAVAFTATIATARAGSGNAYVHNHCNYDVYLWAVDTARNPSTPTTVAAGSSWNEAYQMPKTGGVSIKLSKDNSNSKITQFEYTLSTGQYNDIFYDISQINCEGANCPFASENLYVGASVPSCPQRYCASSDTICTGFYNQPNDDTATLSCDPSADTFFHLCLPDAQMPGGSGAASPKAAAPAAQQASPSPSPSPSPAPSSAPSAPPSSSPAPPKSSKLPVLEALAAHAHARRHLHHRI